MQRLYTTYRKKQTPTPPAMRPALARLIFDSALDGLDRTTFESKLRMIAANESEVVVGLKRFDNIAGISGKAVLL